VGQARGLRRPLGPPKFSSDSLNIVGIEDTRIETLLRQVRQYQPVTVGFSVLSVKMEALRLCCRFLQEYKYKQAQTLVHMYQKRSSGPGETFGPAEVRRAKQPIWVLAPPVVELAGDEYFVIDGAARVVYAAHRRLPAIPCVVVRGVETQATSSDWRRVQSVRVISRPVSPGDNYYDYREEYIRDVHSALRVG
jgi:hypothetical protein